MLQSDWLRYSLSIRQCRYRVATSNATNRVFRKKKKCLFLAFRNNFEEITNTRLFLLKQLDYSLSISMKRWLTWTSPSLTISCTSYKFRARNPIVKYISM